MRTLAEIPTTKFDPPADSFAPAPVETRGITRDGVRLLVARPNAITHTHFADLASQLGPGDVIVVNDSATIAAEFDARSDRHGAVVLHIAAPLDDGSWVLEVRTAPTASRAILDGQPGEVFRGGQISLQLLEPYPRGSSPTDHGNRLWRARVEGDLTEHLTRRGRPIAYGYLDSRYPLAAYQSVFSLRPGSAEMPSAARPFTPSLVAELVTRGVAIAPITLHTGVSSQEAGEAPQAERFSVSSSTARLVNALRSDGGRVVAVGTTATRAIESAVVDGCVVARQGWTERVVTASNPPEIVTGLITGWHDPQASHLLLVEALAGPHLAQAAYDAAVKNGYHWHEFGDSALFLP
ncbi:MAG: S-adenosylmethionine:tRNA ribosyltransferase-isomerase [Antricoccus sp.]